jgi:hypothetical protein
MSALSLSRRRFVAAGAGLPISQILSAIGRAETTPLPVATKTRNTALLVGNWNYKKAPTLNSPPVDIAALATALRACNFDVLHIISNCSVDDANAAIAKFSEDARTSRIALFYYSGHGMQIEGKNYGVPVDFNPDQSVTEMDAEAWNLFDLDWAQSAIGRAGTAGIMVIDACRENPFVDRLSKSNPTRKFKQGLAPAVEPNEYFLVSYATASNQLAKDGLPGQNSLYTGSLIKYIGDPSLTVDQLFRRVTTAVCDASAPGALPGRATDASCQRPEMLSNIGSELVYIVPPQAGDIDTQTSIVSLGLANINDQIVSKYLEMSLDGLRFNYLMLKPDAKHNVARIIPDLPFFTSADRRGTPLIIAGDDGYYEPAEGSGGWGLSYPVLDLVVRTISPNPLTLKSLKIQTRQSREDIAPYFDLVVEALNPFSVTVVNQSWDTIKQFDISFDIVGRRYFAEDDATSFADKEMPTSLPLKASLSDVGASGNIPLFDIIQTRFPEAVFFKFLQEHDVKISSKGVVTARNVDKNYTPVGPSIKLPAGFEDWYKKLKPEYDSFDMNPLWIIGKAIAVGSSGGLINADFMAPICVYNYGVGGGSIEFDLKDFIALPIDGKDFTVESPINKMLDISKQTFRGLYPLVTKKSSFMDINISVQNFHGVSLYSTGWIQLHSLISRNDRKAVIDANKRVAKKI